MSRAGRRIYREPDPDAASLRSSEHTRWREDCRLSNIAFVNALNRFFAKREKGRA